MSVPPNGQPSMIENIDNEATVRDGHTTVSYEQKMNFRVESNNESKVPVQHLVQDLVNYSDSSDDSAEEDTNTNDLHGKLLKE